MNNNQPKPKYRRLNIQELSSLEKEFIYFLSSQGIDAEEWQRMKRDNIQQTDSFIVMFSDFIYDKTLEDVQYLLKKTKKTVRVIQCQSQDMVQVKLFSNNTNLDLTKIDLYNSESYASKSQLKVSMYNKKYSSSGRKTDVFQLLENGFLIHDGSLYKRLCLLLAP